MLHTCLQIIQATFNLVHPIPPQKSNPPLSVKLVFLKVFLSVYILQNTNLFPTNNKFSKDLISEVGHAYLATLLHIHHDQVFGQP